MKVLKKLSRIMPSNKRTMQLKRVWPKGYKRFDTESENNFEIRPRKYNFKLMLLSIILFLILWFFIVKPYLDKHPKEQEPIRVRIFKDDVLKPKK